MGFLGLPVLGKKVIILSSVFVKWILWKHLIHLYDAEWSDTMNIPIKNRIVQNDLQLEIAGHSQMNAWWLYK